MKYYSNRDAAVQSSMNTSKEQHQGSDRQSFVYGLVGENVRINRGGPQSLEGKLLAVKNDHFVLSTENGVAYIATSHVKSITQGQGSKNSNKSGQVDPAYVNASSFKGVIRSYTQKFVQINWGGPEKLEGFLAEVGNDSILLVKGNEAIQIQLFHINTIKEAVKNQSSGNNNKNSDSKNNDSKNNDNKNNDSKNNDGKNKNSNNANKSNGANKSKGNNSEAKSSGNNAEAKSKGNNSNGKKGNKAAVKASRTNK